MRSALFFILFVSFVCYSCEKKNDFSSSRLLTGIKSTKGYDMISVNVDSGTVTGSVPLDCYVVGSTFFDPVTGGYGYVDCDTVLRIVNPETGILIKSFILPGPVSLAVTDNDNHRLIGVYTKTVDTGNDSTKSFSEVYFENHLLTLNLSNGEIISDLKINIGEGVNLSVYYFEPDKNRYVLYRENTHLIQIDPRTGTVGKEISVGRDIFNASYNEEENNLIAIRYSPVDDKYFLEVINSETGALISSKAIEHEDSFCLNISGYDSETGSYYTVNGKYEVIFYSVPSGEVIKRVPLNYPLTDIKFWKRQIGS